MAHHLLFRGQFSKVRVVEYATLEKGTRGTGMKMIRTVKKLLPQLLPVIVHKKECQPHRSNPWLLRRRQLPL
jgi:Mg-chelatase subunit ChlI